MSQARILIVDDDPATVLLYSRLLQKAGYATTIARDATQAVSQAHKDPPALIVTDLMMPAGVGVSVLERRAISSKTSGVPILVMTASEDSALVHRATAAGAVRVLKKPVEPTAFLEAVRDALGESG